MIPICTMTTAFNYCPEGGYIPYHESVVRCHDAGFNVLDVNMCSMINPKANYFCREDWEMWLEKMLQAKEETGITFYQSHPLFRPGAIRSYDDPSQEKYFWDMYFRGLDITARSGAKWAVVHPSNDPTTMDLKTQLEVNHRQFDKVVDYAAKLGIGIAFENMVEPPAGGEKPHRFSSYPEELLELEASYNCDHVKLCWDFGHGNTAVPDRHADAIRMLGDKLVCVHIDDNLGKQDDHFVPFRGNIPWAEVMPVLKEIHFPGVLDLELGLYGKMPNDLKDEACRFTCSIAKKLQALAEG